MSGKIEALTDSSGAYRDILLVAFPPWFHAAEYNDPIALYAGGHDHHFGSRGAMNRAPTSAMAQTMIMATRAKTGKRGRKPKIDVPVGDLFA